MNLAHAVACIGYELARPDPITVGPNRVEEPPRLSTEAREAFLRGILNTLVDLDYPPGRSPEAFVRRFRKILHRANVNQQEISMIGGVFSELHRLGRLAGAIKETQPEASAALEGQNNDGD